MSYRIPAKTYEINLTNKCNLSCKYCFEKDKGKCSLQVPEIEDIIQNPLTTSFYLFGGEPMMNAQFHIDFYNFLQNSSMPEDLKKELWRTASSTTTNGTDIDKHLELFTEYKLRPQISIDGPKEIHDANRTYSNGKGSFDKVMQNIELLKKHNEAPYLHGVVSKNTIPYLFEINKFFFEMELKLRDKKSAIKSFSHNAFMFVIEDDYTDEDVNTAIEQYQKLFNWLQETLPEEEYKECVLSASAKCGSMCGAGHSTLVLGVDGNIYPCHRGNGENGTNREDFTMGDSFTDSPTNIQIYNNYFRHRFSEKTYTCGKEPIIWSGDVFTPQINFCPATYKEVSDTVFYVPPVYYVFMMELGNFLMSKAIEAGYVITDIASYSGKNSVFSKDNEEVQ
jgi:radical SAM protein with 4Fe4S-binding SPASM domain